MNGPAVGRAGLPRVHLSVANTAMCAALGAKLGQAGVELVSERSPDAVLVVAGATVDQALACCPAIVQPGRRRLLVIAESFTAASTQRAVRAGAWTMLQCPFQATSAELLTAVICAYNREARIPLGALVPMLGGMTEEAAAEPGKPPLGSLLTARQTIVLALVAQGYDNATIAQLLSCSPHTVKNAIYDLMGRLQVRNRSHAVARAIRTSLI